MRIGVLGSGLMGGKLGTIFARAGHEVVFSYARSQEKLKALACSLPMNANNTELVLGHTSCGDQSSSKEIAAQLAYEGKGGPDLAYRFEYVTDA